MNLSNTHARRRESSALRSCLKWRRQTASPPRPAASRSSQAWPWRQPTLLKNSISPIVSTVVRYCLWSKFLEGNCRGILTSTSPSIQRLSSKWALIFTIWFNLSCLNLNPDKGLYFELFKFDCEDFFIFEIHLSFIIPSRIIFCV